MANLPHELALIHMHELHTKIAALESSSLPRAEVTSALGHVEGLNAQVEHLHSQAVEWQGQIDALLSTELSEPAHGPSEREEMLLQCVEAAEAVAASAKAEAQAAQALALAAEARANEAEWARRLAEDALEEARVEASLVPPSVPEAATAEIALSQIQPRSTAEIALSQLVDEMEMVEISRDLCREMEMVELARDLNGELRTLVAPRRRDASSQAGMTAAVFSLDASQQTSHVLRREATSQAGSPPPRISTSSAQTLAPVQQHAQVQAGCAFGGTRDAHVQAEERRLEHRSVGAQAAPLAFTVGCQAVALRTAREVGLQVGTERGALLDASSQVEYAQHGALGEHASTQTVPVAGAVCDASVQAHLIVWKDATHQVDVRPATSQVGLQADPVQSSHATTQVTLDKEELAREQRAFKEELEREQCVYKEELAREQCAFKEELEREQRAFKEELAREQCAFKAACVELESERSARLAALAEAEAARAAMASARAEAEAARAAMASARAEAEAARAALEQSQAASRAESRDESREAEAARAALEQSQTQAQAVADTTSPHASPRPLSSARVAPAPMDAEWSSPISHNQPQSATIRWMRNGPLRQLRPRCSLRCGFVRQRSCRAPPLARECLAVQSRRVRRRPTWRRCAWPHSRSGPRRRRRC